MLEEISLAAHKHVYKHSKYWRPGLSLNLALNPTLWHIIKFTDGVRVGPKVHVGNTLNNVTMETSPSGDKDTEKPEKKDHRLNPI